MRRRDEPTIIDVVEYMKKSLKVEREWTPAVHTELFFTDRNRWNGEVYLQSEN